MPELKSWGRRNLGWPGWASGAQQQSKLHTAHHITDPDRSVHLAGTETLPSSTVNLRRPSCGTALAETRSTGSLSQIVVDPNNGPLTLSLSTSTNVGVTDRAVQTSSTCALSEARLELTPQGLPSVTSASSNIGTDSSAARSNATTASSNSEKHVASDLTPPGDQEQNVDSHATSSEDQRTVIDLNRESKELIYPFKNVSGLFVGFDHKVKPPSARWEHWKENVEGRLWLDVQGFQNRYKRKRNGRVQTPGVGIECRMSGYATADGKQVILSPTIWFLYDDKQWERKLRKFVEKLEWLPGEGFGRPEVHRGCPRFANLHVPLEALRLSPQQGYPIGGDVELFIHVEETWSLVACGLLFCATFMKNGVVEAQHISRIGGLVSLDGRVSAVTTAHGFLQHILRQVGTEAESWATHSDEGSTEQTSDLASSDESYSDTDGTTSKEKKDDDLDDKSEYRIGPGRLIGALDPKKLATISWAQFPVSSIQETCFLGTIGRNVEDCVRASKFLGSGEAKWGGSAPGGGDNPRLSTANSTTGDFSYLDLLSLSKLRNFYWETQRGTQVLDGVPVDRFATPEELTEGPVDLLLRPYRSTRGTLMPAGHEILFSLYGAMVRVSKIAIDAPLGEPTF